MSDTIDLSKLVVEETHGFEFFITTADYLGLSNDRSISRNQSSDVEQRNGPDATGHEQGSC